MDSLKTRHEKIEFSKTVENSRVSAGKDTEGSGYNHCTVSHKRSLNENRKKIIIKENVECFCLPAGKI